MTLTSYSVFKPRADSGRFIASKVDEAVLEGVTAVAQRVLEAAQGYCPVDTGALRESGHIEVATTGKQVAAAVVFDVPYAVYVEFGTGQRGASSAGAGPGPYSSTWKGMAASPFLRPAWDEVKTQAVSMTKATVTAGLG